jgi:hypothetical protein
MTATATTLAGARPSTLSQGCPQFWRCFAKVLDIVLGFGWKIVTYGAKPAAC